MAAKDLEIRGAVNKFCNSGGQMKGMRMVACGLVSTIQGMAGPAAAPSCLVYLRSCGAFHDRSTKIFPVLHPDIFNFGEILSIGSFCALNSMVTSADSQGQRFSRYSLGHFGKVTLQGDFYRPVSPKPLNQIHHIGISS